ncbi:MAG TPA: hypothetical protein VF519_13465 [Mycobacteriales bacterium]
MGAALGTYDLWYDASTVGANLIVECRISHGPRAADPTFDPHPGDVVSIGDADEPPLRGRVVARRGDQVRVLVAVVGVR